MRPTDVLKAEHEGILLMLRIVGKVCGKLKSGEKVDTRHLDQILEFLTIFVDKCHHGKEEDLLFPAMEEAGIPKKGGPIGAMLLEHARGRDYIKAMSEAVRRYKASDRGAPPAFVEAGKEYVALLTQHIEKENTILFPMADARLSEDKQEKLVEEFEKLEVERIGEGKHEEFHKLLNQLHGIYLEGDGAKGRHKD